MSRNLKVVQTTSRVLEIIYKVVGILCLVGAIGSLVGVVGLSLARFFPKIADKIVSSSDRTIRQLIGDCLVGFIVCATSFVVCKAHKDFFAMEQKVGTPFTVECAASFRTLGIINIVVPIALSIVTAIIGAIFACWNDIRFDFNLGLGLAMVLLSYVFAYGAELEKKGPTADAQEDAKAVISPKATTEVEEKK